MRRFALVLLLLGTLVPVPRGAAARSQGAICAPRTAIVGHGFGAPDDLALLDKHILFSDTAAGKIGVLRNGIASTLVSGLSVPEGMVVRKGHTLVVAEQGRNRLVSMDLSSGQRHVLVTLPNTTGLEGVDGIAPAPNGGIYVPDSPNGRLYRLDRSGTLHLIAGGLQRPVHAIKFGSGVAVADENARAVWNIQGHRITRLATLPSPDDVALVGSALITITLLDGTLWEVSPRVQPLLRGFGELQGLVALNGDAVAVADSRRNTIVKITGLSHCL